jgi:hypothetical protein
LSAGIIVRGTLGGEQQRLRWPSADHEAELCWRMSRPAISMENRHGFELMRGCIVNIN